MHIHATAGCLIGLYIAAFVWTWIELFESEGAVASHIGMFALSAAPFVSVVRMFMAARKKHKVYPSVAFDLCAVFSTFMLAHLEAVSVRGTLAVLGRACYIVLHILFCLVNFTLWFIEFQRSLQTRRLVAELEGAQVQISEDHLSVLDHVRPASHDD